MKKLILVAFLAMLSTGAVAAPSGSTAQAGAIGVGVGVAGANSSSNNRNLNHNRTNVNTNSSSLAVQGQSVGQEVNNPVSVVDNSVHERAKVAANTANVSNIASNWKCHGSATAGVQGLKFGIAFGSSKESSSCQTMALSERLQQLGLHVASVYAMCNYPDGAEALKAEGIICGEDFNGTINVPDTTYISTMGSNNLFQ